MERNRSYQIKKHDVKKTHVFGSLSKQKNKKNDERGTSPPRKDLGGGKKKKHL